MRIAVIGGGISGLTAARELARDHEVVVFEAERRIGGHTHTVPVTVGGREHRIDTGFIVFNPVHYPNFCRMLDELGVASQPTEMSFAYADVRADVEYNATDLDRLFVQRRNLVRPAFLAMVRDILRFYREAPELIASGDDSLTLGEFLRDGGYSDAFRDWHLLPMAAALWSSPRVGVMDFPARYLCRFMDNHHMLQVDGRPPWRVVAGGSDRYLQALLPRLPAELRSGVPVTSLRRLHGGGVELRTPGAAPERFDHAVIACHSDQALALRSDASPSERAVLGAIRYQDNEVVLHTDTRLLPRRRRAWAAWNYLAPEGAERGASVTYDMNILQSIRSDTTFCVTLNRSADIDPAQVLFSTVYAHPVYDPPMLAAQQRRAEIQGDGIWYCGAYWGFGFHEDGARSALDVVQAIRAEAAQAAA